MGARPRPHAPSLLWSIGVSILQPIFDAGRIQANVDFARGGYDVTVGNYRRIVLIAMQEAEDGITSLAALDSATAQARVAIASTQRVLEIANSRYEGGVATYLDVITAQQGLLNNERLHAQLQGQQLLTTVFLIKALGGDWQGNPKLASDGPAFSSAGSAR
jgi:outer membrane protein TolC